MTHPVKLNRILWIIISALVILSSSVGLFRPALYKEVIAASIEPGVFAQDAVALAASLALLILAIIYRGTGARRRIAIHGILGFFLYAYGIYAIEQIYTWLYPAYLAVFGLSLYGLVYGMATATRDKTQPLSPPRWVVIGSAVLGIFIALMFNAIWISQLVPLIRSADRIEYTYSVYIIDLCLVMPAFVIASVMALRSSPVGLAALPALFLVGVGILSPLAIGELLKPARYGVPADQSGLVLYAALTVLFAGAFVLYTALLPQRSRQQ